MQSVLEIQSARETPKEMPFSLFGLAGRADVAWERLVWDRRVFQ